MAKRGRAFGRVRFCRTWATGTDEPAHHYQGNEMTNSIETEAAVTSRSDLEAAVADLATDFAPLVKDIEGGIKTTLGHYGRYLQLLIMFDDPGSRSLAALALKHAGADTFGVDAAMRQF